MITPPRIPANEENESPKTDGIDNSIRGKSPKKNPFRFILYRVIGEKSSAERHLVFATYFLGLATLGLAYFAFDQSSSIKDTLHEQRRYDSLQLIRIDSQLSVSRESMQRQLRAYIGINLDRDRTREYKGCPQFDIINSGLTPAYNVRVWIAYGLRVYPLSYSLNTDTTQKADEVFSLNPREDRWIETYIVPSNKADSVAYVQKKKAVYYWGRIVYSDAFRIEHWTTFRLMCGGKFDVSECGVCTEGNDAN